MSRSSALGPSIWVASDGRAGNENQALALARAIGEMGLWMRVAHIRGEAHRKEALQLTPRGWQTILPANKWPWPLSSLPKDQKAAFQAPWPTIWIGAGRKTAPFSAGIRKWSNGATYAVHILDPKVDPCEFDLLVTPDHDGITGPNVVSTIGAPAYFAPEDIEETELNFADMKEEQGFKICVILGGDSNTHKMTEDVCASLEKQLRGVAANGAKLRITCSRRTPTHARVRFRKMAEEIGARFWESPADGKNPYLAFLLMSDAAIVTEDSANMIADAAYFGLPIHLARLSGHSKKFDRLHKSFIDHGAARWFEGEISQWQYEPVREVDRVARRIVDDILIRHPAPELQMPTGPREISQDRRK